MQETRSCTIEKITLFGQISAVAAFQKIPAGCHMVGVSYRALMRWLKSQSIVITIKVQKRKTFRKHGSSQENPLKTGTRKKKNDTRLRIKNWLNTKTPQTNEHVPRKQ